MSKSESECEYEGDRDLERENANMRERERERKRERMRERFRDIARENAKEREPNAYELKSEQCFLVADTRLHIASSVNPSVGQCICKNPLLRAVFFFIAAPA